MKQNGMPEWARPPAELAKFFDITVKKVIVGDDTRYIFMFTKKMFELAIEVGPKDGRDKKRKTAINLFKWAEKVKDMVTKAMERVIKQEKRLGRLEKSDVKRSDD